MLQSHGAQEVPAAQAGQAQTGADVVPPLGAPVTPVLAGIVVVVVAAALQTQLQAGQVAPAGQTGQLHVQVPLPEPTVSPQPPPELPPEPVLPPVPPAPVPPLPVVPPPPQSHAQGGHASPAAQAGQPQVQVPPPVELPASWAGGGGQSQATAGQAPSLGQARGWMQPHPPEPVGACQQ